MIRSIAVALVFAATLVGCAGPSLDMDKAALVKPGMTKAQVLQMIGSQPTSVIQLGSDTLMSWAEYNALTRQMKQVTFTFGPDGKVKHSPQDQAAQQQKAMIDYMAQKGVGMHK